MVILQLLTRYSHEPIYAVAAIAGVGLGILGALAVHEYAHAWMATRLGDDTAKRLGRLTLNPFAHIDLLGLFLFVVAGFGFGKPVPYNERALKHDTDEIKIAVAGPISNLILAFILALPHRLAILFNWPVTDTALFLFLDALITLNIVLAVFNLIPIPPLDGSRVINYFLDDEARAFWQQIGPILLLVLVFSNILFQGAGSFNLLSQIMTPLMRIAFLIVLGTPPPLQ